MNQLLLGVGRATVTPDAVGTPLCGYSPDLLSESINDDLTVTAFWFQSGDTVALMISATVCEIQTALSDRLRQILSQTFALPLGNVLLCATHTHSGPNLMGAYGWGDINTVYLETVFLPRLLEAVRTASENTRPVRMGVGVGDSFVGVNRRELTKEGKIIFGQTPWGAFDPGMTVLSFLGEDGKCVANIIHYAAHGTAAGLNTEISRDWSGVMTDRLEEETGGITAFFNGPEGDIGPRLTNGKTTGNITLAMELGGVAAQDAIRIQKTIRSYHTPTLCALCSEVTVPLSPRIPLEEARAGYEQYKTHTINIHGALKEHYRQIIECYETGAPESPFSRFPQTLIRLGEVIFVSFPYELFSEIGMRIAREVTDAHTLSLSNANGADGYFVTEDQICRGGYEVDMFLGGQPQGYRPDSDTHLVLETLKNIDELKKEGR